MNSLTKNNLLILHLLRLIRLFTSSHTISVPPQVTIYHTALTRVPRGLGPSATAFQYAYYIVDAIGQDQLDFNQVKSNCQIREKDRETDTHGN